MGGTISTPNLQVTNQEEDKENNDKIWREAEKSSYSII